ncbi:type IV pilin N-terminal domain-containing protein [Methanococcoides sp. SA1]|nr:type IV pilin N-terminal domain-containing protein [Methanococcoides sp. SA1]
MIVVTVILAAAVSSFSGSITTKDEVPTATFKVSASFSEEAIKIEHLGGDPIDKNFVKFEISSGRPRMTSYFDNANVTIYPKNEYSYAPNVIQSGKVAIIKIPIKDYASDGKYTDLAGQLVAIGEPFEFKIIDRETDTAIYATKIVMQP